jgi:hypothetical protein
MKLAEIASAGTDWKFADDEEAEACNGGGDNHHDSPAKSNAKTLGVNNNGNGVDGDSSVNGSFLGSPSSHNLSGGSAAHKVDPVNEVAPNLQVKIADLGNACWVVSTASLPVASKSKLICVLH